MSIDRREQILVRLMAVCEAITGEGKVFRNQIEIPETKRPAIVIFDADEIADEDDNARKRPPLAPRIVAMTPEIHILAEGKPDTAAKPGEKKVGETLNTLRRTVIKAVLSDPSLVELCHDGDIRYDGFTTGLAAGRSMEAEAGLGFTFRYVLRPDKL